MLGTTVGHSVLSLELGAVDKNQVIDELYGKWIKLQPYKQQEGYSTDSIIVKQVGNYLGGIILWQLYYYLLSPAWNFEGKFLYGTTQMGKMEFNLSAYNWERWVSIRNMNVAPNHLGVRMTALFMFPVAVNSSKQGIIKVCLTLKALVVLNIISSRTDVRSFSPCYREAVCQNKLLGTYVSGDQELQSKIDPSIRMQWDLGIHNSGTSCVFSRMRRRDKLCFEGAVMP
jgi:hypothetical protein